MPQQPPPRALNQYLDRWALAHLSCERADRATAEEGVELAYAAAGLRPPQRVVWCSGPLEIAEYVANAASTDCIGCNVKVQVFDDVCGRVGTLSEIFWKEVLAASTERQATMRMPLDVYNRSRIAHEMVHRAVFAAVDRRLRRLATRGRHALLRLRGMPRLLPSSGFDEIAVGPCDVGALGVYKYLHDVLDWQDPSKPLRGLWKIAQSAGWLVPHEHVSWICERPSCLHTDARGRLHCADGPALRYPDGWSVYAWKGVEVPAWLIAHPERISLQVIANTFDPILRNTMIEILTPERFVARGGARLVARDEAGTLWRRLWTYRGVTVGSWTAVEVINGTPAADGSRKHYFLRVPSRIGTPREAVAWTYGLADHEYAALELRT
jgi:hypothetical protein